MEILVKAIPDKQFLTLSYRYTLWRDPDPEGTKYFLSKLQSQKNRQSILTEILSSSEAKNSPRNRFLTSLKTQTAEQLLKERELSTLWPFTPILRRYQRLVNASLFMTEQRMSNCSSQSNSSNRPATHPAGLGNSASNPSFGLTPRRRIDIHEIRELVRSLHGHSAKQQMPNT